MKKYSNSSSTVDVKTKTSKSLVSIQIDRSGSTGVKFREPGLTTVLEKEIEVISKYILDHPDYDFEVQFFDDRVTPIERVVVNWEEQFVDLPNVTPGNTTYTHLGFKQINDKIKAGGQKPNIVILVTDGQTNSSRTFLENEIKLFKEKNIEFIIMAVCPNNQDYNSLRVDEKNIPGMDILGLVGNLVDTFYIYNQIYEDVPYEGAKSSSVDKNKLMFLGHPIDRPITEFVNEVLNLLREYSGMIDWGKDNINFKKVLVEIGKLFSALFVSFPDDNPFIYEICSTLFDTCQIDGMTYERILNMIKYGFSCSQNKKPIILTNFEEHVKEAAVKQAQFADANSELQCKGTTLGYQNTLGISLNGRLVVINNSSLEVDSPFESFPNSMNTIGDGIVFFPIDQSNDQAIRIALRGFANRQGYQNARNSPSVIFMISNLILSMLMTGHSIDSEYIKVLRQLAISQVSMEVMISHQKYSGISVYNLWKNGERPRMHFSREDTHTSLYKDLKINPAGLSETLWWASMMYTLGLFNEQLSVYEPALRLVGIEPTEENFLNFLLDKYSSNYSGKIECVTLNPRATSIFTLDHFGSDEVCFRLSDHGPETSRCKVNSVYNDQEKVYVLNHGCPWCHRHVNDSMFELCHNVDPIKIIDDAMIRSRSLNIIGSTLPLAASASAVSNGKLVCVNMIGCTGAGKSTTASMIKAKIQANGGVCHIVSSDYYDKKNIKGSEKDRRIREDIGKFESIHNNFKVLVIDLCNDKGPQKKIFGCDLSKYQTFDFYPNLDKSNFGDYECWCLLNVISRQIHTDTTSYWLNPVSAGLNVCIKVHNMKASGIKRISKISQSCKNFSESLSRENLLLQIEDSAKRYAEYLATKSLDTEIDSLIHSFSN